MAMDRGHATVMKPDIPESLMIAVESRHYEVVRDWWHDLSDDQRAEFLAIAVLRPEEISQSVAAEDESPLDDVNEWYEYLVNQDVRFYFDRSNPQGDYNLLCPTLAPASSAADADVVRQLLTRRNTDS
jgi:hypothetical protein